mmetsp:Transcript_14381/g.33224  ORF Transcript_14381/g.33224 Transcript_14381/m.33224 type:complete len:127 (+) Transcript_14381:260-640(+)
MTKTIDNAGSHKSLSAKQVSLERVPTPNTFRAVIQVPTGTSILYPVALCLLPSAQSQYRRRNSSGNIQSWIFQEHYKYKQEPKDQRELVSTVPCPSSTLAASSRLEMKGLEELEEDSQTPSLFRYM